jgi:hypothetical protein
MLAKLGYLQLICRYCMKINGFQMDSLYPNLFHV